MTDGAIVQVKDDLIVYRASGIGTYCLKQLIAARMEYDPLPTPSRMQQVFDKGSETEDRIIQQLTVSGPTSWTIAWKQKEYDWHVTGRIVVRCHIDGMRVPSYRVVEVKSQGESEWDPPHIEKSPFWERYQWQISSMMLATGRGLDLVVVRRQENDDGLLDFYVLKFDEPPIPASEIRKKVLQVEAAARQDKLPDECDVALYPCPYYYLHSEVHEAGELEVPAEDVVVLARQYNEAGIEEKQAKERREATKKALDKAIKGDEAVVPDGDGEFIKITFYQGSSSRVDQEKMKADGVDVEKYKTKTTFRGLRVTLPK